MTTAIERKRGDTYPIDILVTQDLGSGPVALDVSGCGFVLTVDSRKDPDDASTHICQLVGSITNAAGGAVSFYPTAADMDHLGKFYYDVQMTDGAGKKRTVVKDTFVLKQDITKL